MKAIVTRYLNEIVGLSIMALMTIALIAAQSSALANQRSHLADQAAADSSRITVEISLKMPD